ncbi:MAG: hypothetical protein IJ802_00385 [Kiritimatiellae bacterium]|nr:hypothetical protein [Kiritimatiellia bacterium]
MDCKKMFALASALPAFAFATTVESANTLGVMKVTSAYADTIIAVPWVECGTGDSVKVKDLVKTANLNDGSYLYYWTKDSYEEGEGGAVSTSGLSAFELKNGAWEGVAISTVGNPNNATAGSDTAGVPRGTAVLLHRNTGTHELTEPFYVYGQVDDASATAPQTTIAKGVNLIASPLTSDLDVNEFFTEAKGAADGDMIVAPKGNIRETFTYYASVGKWMQFVKDASKRYECKVDMGHGFWYIRNGDEDMTISWE